MFLIRGRKIAGSYQSTTNQLKASINVGRNQVPEMAAAILARKSISALRCRHLVRSISALLSHTRSKYLLCHV